MNLNELEVYNALYELEITEEEYEQLQKEQDNENHTGIHITLTKQKGNKKIGICINHDIDGEILIQKLDELTSKAKAGDRILYDTITTIKDIPPEMYAIHTITLQDTDDGRDHDYEIRTNKKATTPEELKDAMIHALRRGPYQLELNHVKALHKIFNQKYEDKKTRINVRTITEVLTKKNARIAVMQEIEKYDKTIRKGWNTYDYKEIDQTSYHTKSYTPQNPEYDYVSPGRELCGNVWLSDELQGNMPAPELEQISDHKENKYDQTFLLLTPDKYTTIKQNLEEYGKRKAKKEEENEIQKKLEQNIKKQFKKGKTTRHGITYTKKYSQKPQER